MDVTCLILPFTDVQYVLSYLPFDPSSTHSVLWSRRRSHGTSRDRRTVRSVGDLPVCVPSVLLAGIVRDERCSRRSGLGAGHPLFPLESGFRGRTLGWRLLKLCVCVCTGSSREWCAEGPGVWTFQLKCSCILKRVLKVKSQPWPWDFPPEREVPSTHAYRVRLSCRELISKSTLVTTTLVLAF